MSDSFEQQVRMESLGGPGIHRQVLYDASRVGHLSESLFVPEQTARIDTTANTSGRAQVVVHCYEGRQLVSKHYHRGGMVAALLGDRYFGRQAENSRAFREWCMLSAMKKQGLPVPVPIAASRIQTGLWYRADLVTQFIPNSQTLADLLVQAPLEAAQWRNIGRVIRCFHDSHVWHADLNARNILIEGGGDVSLIDFDKSGFRKSGRYWRNANLARLKRSLDKFAASRPAFHFTQQDWRMLLDAYS